MLFPRNTYNSIKISKDGYELAYNSDIPKLFAENQRSFREPEKAFVIKRAWYTLCTKYQP